MLSEVVRLEIPELDNFEQQRTHAYNQLNAAERDLDSYGDVVDFIGESTVERYNVARRTVKALTQAGILAGYLTKELTEE